MKKITILISGLVLSAGVSYAQTLSPTVIGSAGDTYYGGNVSLSWTVGEVAISTVSSAGNYLTQGFHQPENGITIGIASPDKLVSINAFPNPISENLTLEIKTDKPESFLVEVTDVLGKLVKSTSLYVGDGQAQHSISMSTFAPGAYLVKVTSSNGKFTKAIKLTKI
jgi:hypothetical protein